MITGPQQDIEGRQNCSGTSRRGGIKFSIKEESGGVGGLEEGARGGSEEEEEMNMLGGWRWRTG